MDPIFVLVVILFAIQWPCRCVEYIDIVLNGTAFERRLTPVDLDNENIVKNKIRFLKLLPLYKEWKDKIEENAIDTENRTLDTVPIVLILAASDSNENDGDSSEYETVETQSIGFRDENQDTQNIYEESGSSNEGVFVNLNVTNEEEMQSEIQDSIDRIRETLTEKLREKLTTTNKPINYEINFEIQSEENVENEEVIEDLAEIGEVKNDVDHVLWSCKEDPNGEFIREENSLQHTKDAHTSEKNRVGDSRKKCTVDSGDHSVVTHRSLIVINKYMIMK